MSAVCCPTCQVKAKQRRCLSLPDAGDRQSHFTATVLRYYAEQFIGSLVRLDGKRNFTSSAVNFLSRSRYFLSSGSYITSNVMNFTSSAVGLTVRLPFAGGNGLTEDLT